MGRIGATARPLARRLRAVRDRMLALSSSVDLAPYGAGALSARNLLHYLAFRGCDLRREQTRLAHLALSSLGRSESHALYNLEAVLGWLDRTEPGGPPAPAVGLDPERGRRILARNARALLGPPSRGRGARIMGTLPAESATDDRLVLDLVRAGMEIAQINCAHDGPGAWLGMIERIRRAERATGRRCRIELDLAGPKLRTGPVRPGPAVVKVRPCRDALGRVIRPGEAWLADPADARPVPGGTVRLPVPRRWLERRRAGDRIAFVDARGAKRVWTVSSAAAGRARVTAEKSAYIVPGTELLARRKNGPPDRSTVGPMSPIERRIELSAGDRLHLTGAPDPGEEAVRDRRGRVRRPAHIACTLPEALAFVRPGEGIWLDDGRIGGRVVEARPDRLDVEIAFPRTGRARLAGDRGINLPDTRLDLPPLTPKDLEDLRFVARHADLVGYSFVRSPEDVARLRAELGRLGRGRLGIVLKIETRRAFEALPALLLAALRHPPVGVMVARGDLAIEVGFERLAEVQEEILWLCEAAHLPAIWATQVLEGLAKSGQPSRAEVTDAAMGERAECVMLNKGPHMVEAVAALDGILRRMQSHQTKKTARLRHLRVVESFLSGIASGPSGAVPP